MNDFCQELVRIRLELNHSTIKSFYNYLNSRGLDCNYQYFVKILNGQTLPTHIIVNQIIKSLNKQQGEALINVYCSVLFQSHKYLFKKKINTSLSLLEPNQLEINQGQKLLSILQVSTLAKSKENYFLFLVLTLSRKGLKLDELNKLNKKFQKAMKELQKVKIAFVESECLFSMSNEFRFPKENSAEIEACYRMFDQWDATFGEEFNFKNIINKMMTRIISPRYLNLITKQIDLLSDQIRISDEIEGHYNTEVVQLQIKLNSGKVIG